MFKKLSFLLIITHCSLLIASAQWVQQNSGTNADFTSVSFLNLNTGMVTGGNLNGGLIFKTTNGGQVWYPLPTGNTSGFYDIYMLDENIAFVCGDSVLRTTNGGATWTGVLGRNGQIYTMTFVNDNTGFVGSDFHFFYKTTNKGLNWINVCTTCNNYDNNPSYYGSDKINDTLAIFVGTLPHPENSQYIKYTTRIGPNSITNNQTNGGIGIWWDVAFGNYNNGCISAGGYTGWTTNSGTTWNQTNWITSAKYVDFISPTVAFGLTGDPITSISYTTNGGQNWTLDFTWNSGLRGIQMITSTDGVVVGANGTILRNNFAQTGIHPISTEIPNQFSLSQNYPNPFNPGTRIRFQAPLSPPEGGKQVLSLIIYDVLGREVASLIPPLWGGQEGLGPGTYELSWDASNYPSGVYYYELSAGDFTETKKMVLIK